MFYKINASTDPAVIGKVNAQAERGIWDVHSDDPRASKNLYLKKASNIDEVVTVKPVLAKGAILTDLLSGSANGTGMLQPMISDKLKRILEKHIAENMQFFPMTVLYNNIELNNFWLVNAYEFTPETINFERSVFFVDGLGGAPLRQISIGSVKEFNSTAERLTLPERLRIETLVLRADISDDLIVLRRVSGGIGFYVSEKLRYEIEEAGCTGIVFEPVEVT